MCCSTNASFYASHKPRFFILGLHTVRLKQPAYPIMHHARYEEHSFYFWFFFFFFSSFLLYYYSSYKQATRRVSPTEPRRHDIHAPKAREKERSYLLGLKRANDKTRFGDFSAPKVLFPRVRACEAYAAASLTATFFFSLSPNLS